MPKKSNSAPKKTAIKTTTAPKSPKKSPKTKKIGVGRFLWGIIPVLVLLWFCISYASIFAKTDRHAHTITVTAGDTYSSILSTNKWQTNPFSSNFIAKAYLRFTGKKPLHEGVYSIPANASFDETIKILQNGAKVAMVSIQIIEGKTIKELYHIIKNTDGIDVKILTPKKADYTWVDVMEDNQRVAAAFEIGSINGNLEGQFAPDTYYFSKGTSDEAVLRRLHKRQMDLLDKAWQNRKPDLPYKNKNELLIMASIVERETGVAAERPQVAAVFINRLRQNMRLQTDPTIIYGLFDRYDGKIYKSNINEKTDYNTYQINGLPPTPIALPSELALTAAANPDTHNYLYFVATGKGGHKFSETLDQHNEAVAEYRRVMANK